MNRKQLVIQDLNHEIAKIHYKIWFQLLKELYPQDQPIDVFEQMFQIHSYQCLEHVFFFLFYAIIPKWRRLVTNNRGTTTDDINRCTKCQSILKYTITQVDLNGVVYGPKTRHLRQYYCIFTIRFRSESKRIIGHRNTYRFVFLS